MFLEVCIAKDAALLVAYFTAISSADEGRYMLNYFPSGDFGSAGWVDTAFSSVAEGI